MLQKTTDLAPINLFEEMRKLNLELLEALLEAGRMRVAPVNLPKPHVA